MREEFKSSYWKDFQQRYLNTFGWFEKENGARMLTMLTKVDDCRLIFTDKTGAKYQANADQGNFFTFLPVERGVYEMDDEIVSVRRVPQRMWKRGICSDNTSITSLDGNKVAVDFPVLEKVFGEKDDTRLTMFKSSLKGNVVFNQNFALHNNTVYLYENPVGKFSSKDRSITMSTPLFRQELQDIVQKHQLPILIK